MNCVMASIVFTLMLLFGGIYASGSSNCGNPAPPPQTILYVAEYYCEGSEAGNITLYGTGTLTSDCMLDTNSAQNVMVQNSKETYKRSVNTFQVLARSAFPVGAYLRLDTLFLVNGGSLQGMYILDTGTFLKDTYFKKCSSPLGYAVKPSNSTILISPKLDANVLISNDVRGAFKKSATTICTGSGYIV